MPKHLTSSDSYFGSNGEFKKKYGTFSDVSVIGEHLSDIINGRSPEHAEKFEGNINSLTHEFEKSPAAEKAFYVLLDECRAFGLVQMALRRAKHSHYHTPEHAAELADDTEQGLTEKFKTEFPQDKANRLFIALAKAAASWHDIVQDRGVPPNNEVESAKQFVVHMNELLEDYKQKFNFMTPAIENFQKELDFLSKELIVYDTWLVFGMEPGLKLVAKTLTERAQHVIQDINAKRPDEKINIAETPNMRRLYSACEMISNGDTKRFGMEHVLKEQLILKALRNFPPANQKILDDFFKEAGIIDDRAKEQFLGLMCQNIRIFPELNKPESTNDSNSSGKLISEVEHDSYVKICDDIKTSPSYAINKDASPKTHAMFNNFMNTENLQGKNNISREISFALAQQDPMWDLHAKHLNDFIKYVKKISANDPKSRDLLAETLIVLATRFQPGNYLLKKDKTFHAQLRDVEKWQKQVMANKATNKVSPLPSPSSKKLSVSQSAIVLLFSTAGLKTYSLPFQAKLNLDSALSRFATSYFSSFISRFSSRRSSVFQNSMQDKPPSFAVKNIFKVESSKLVSSKSDHSEAEHSSSKSYLESRNRADSNSVFKHSPPTGYKKSQRHITHKNEDGDDSNDLSRPKK